MVVEELERRAPRITQGHRPGLDGGQISVVVQGVGMQP